MTVYYVDDGGSATAPYDTWAKAATSVSALDDAVALASGDVVYIGHDHICQYAHVAARTITGPTSGLPCVLISATTGSDPPMFQKSVTAQIDTSEGAYSITFDGSFAFYGVRVNAGTNITFTPDSDEYTGEIVDCTLALGPNGILTIGSSNANTWRVVRLTIDLTGDGSSNRAGTVYAPNGGQQEVSGLTFVNAAYRTGSVIDGTAFNAVFNCSGADFSGFTNATACELINSDSRYPATLVNCKTAATWTPFDATSMDASHAPQTVMNCGPADAPTYLAQKKFNGQLLSSASIYRNGGATIEGESTAWLVTTTANCSESVMFALPWIYGHITTTGSKTFDVCITNDTADFTDAEVWMEVEYMGAADSPLYTLGSDQRATITTTPAAQTDDTTSTWTGAGPSYTYKQKLSVTATVNETGLYRARVAVGVTSIASSRYFYVDPKVTVS